MKFYKTMNAVNTIAVQDETIGNGIMIVDDSKFSRNILKDILKNEGFEVVAEARNGQEAVDMTSQVRPRYIFMDVEMPVLDGLGAIPKILELDPNVHIIMCTAMGQKNIIVEAARAGAKDYVLKPYKRENIIRVLSVFETQQRSGQVIPFKDGKKSQEEVKEIADTREYAYQYSREEDKKSIQEVENVPEYIPQEISAGAKVTEKLDIRSLEVIQDQETMADEILKPLEIEEEAIPNAKEDFLMPLDLETGEEGSKKYSDTHNKNDEGITFLQSLDMDDEYEGNPAEKAVEEVVEEVQTTTGLITDTEYKEIEPAETGFADTKYDETEHVEAELAETEHAQLEHAETEHVEAELAETEHAQLEHAEAEHAETKYADTEHAETDYADTDHAETDYADTEHAEVENSSTQEDAEIIKEENVLIVDETVANQEETMKIDDPENSWEEEMPESFTKEESIEGLASEEKEEKPISEMRDEIINAKALIPNAHLIAYASMNIEEKQDTESCDNLSCLNDFNYLWEKRLDTRQNEILPNDTVNQRLSIYRIIHLTDESYGLSERINSEKEIISGMTKAYLSLDNRLQQEEILEHQNHACPEGLRLSVSRILENESSVSDYITMEDILKLSGSKTQENTKVFIQKSSLSNAVAQLVQNKTGRNLANNCNGI